MKKIGNSQNMFYSAARLTLPDEKDIGSTIVPARAQSWDPNVEKRVVRKVDRALLPVMVIGYTLQWYDKAILGGAAVFGMNTDLQLKVVDPTTHRSSTERLSWATSIFYFGMLAGLFPLTYLFQRFHIGRTVGTFVIIWGAVAMSTAGVTTFRGLYAQRFFLGFCESIVPTCFMTMVSSFYTQEEQTWRQCIWYTSNAIGAAVGAVLNYAFAHIHNAPLKSWQYLYLLAGSLTVIVGMAIMFFPNSPADAWFLDQEEQRVAVERLRRGQQGLRCQKIKFYQIREALFDLKIWIIPMMLGIGTVLNGAITGFGPLIVSTLGWSVYDSLLLQIPAGFLAGITMLAVGFLSLKFKNIRLLLLVLTCLPTIAGCVMIWRSSWYHRAAAPLVGYIMLPIGSATWALIISLAMVNVAGASKKSYVSAATYVWYCVGNIIGPQLIVTQTVDQHYPRLWTAVIVCYVLLIILSGAVFVMFRSENRRRDSLNLDPVEGERIAFDDLTDKENMHFRYAY